jgi:hypothetical protein
MSPQVRCHCRSCTIRGLMGPAIVITIGVLFLLHQTHGGKFFFGNTFPVILLVIGVIQLASALAPHDGHIEIPGPGAIPPPPMPPAPPVVPPPAVPPQSPYSAQGQ